MEHGKTHPWPLHLEGLFFTFRIIQWNKNDDIVKIPCKHQLPPRRDSTGSVWTSLWEWQGSCHWGTKLNMPKVARLVRDYLFRKYIHFKWPRTVHERQKASDDFKERYHVMYEIREHIGGIQKYKQMPGYMQHRSGSMRFYSDAGDEAPWLLLRVSGLGHERVLWPAWWLGWLKIGHNNCSQKST